MNVLEAKKWLLTFSVYNYFVGKGNKEKFNEIYNLTFGKIDFCEGCSSEVDMAITKLKKRISLLNENKELKFKIMQMKYAFKKETRLFCYSLGLMVTKHNLTDEIAEEIIKENPKHADLFNILEATTKKKKGKKSGQSIHKGEAEVQHEIKKDKSAGKKT